MYSLRADDTSYQEGSVYGKRFANSGGVTAAVIESMKEKKARMLIARFARQTEQQSVRRHFSS